MSTRYDIIEEARRWVGTRYKHQHRHRGHYVDCVGLIIGVGLECGVLDWTPQDFKPWSGYSRTPNPRQMTEGLARFLEPVDGRDPALGDIAYIAWEEAPHLPMHLAILSEFQDRRTIIHASHRVGRCVEHGMDTVWQGRVVSWWSYPGVED